VQVAPRVVGRMNTTLPLRRLSWIPIGWMTALAGVALTSSMPGRIGVIVAASFLCMRLGPRVAELQDALLVGAAWILLDIAAEVVLGAATGHEWHGLIGPNAVLLPVWLAAPLVFARRG
jgi:hypothetical protein